MPPKAVYRFEVWDQNIGDNVIAPRFATLETIGRVNGVPIVESMRTVDGGDLDGSGFYPKPGVWLVKIFDVVSRQDGTARRSVPLGEYTMREVSTDLYSLSGDLLPVSFELNLVEVATYLPGEKRPGKMKIIAGTWP
jgi:hypothetical protein